MNVSDWPHSHLFRHTSAPCLDRVIGLFGLPSVPLGDNGTLVALIKTTGIRQGRHGGKESEISETFAVAVNICLSTRRSSTQVSFYF